MLQLSMCNFNHCHCGRSEKLMGDMDGGKIQACYWFWMVPARLARTDSLENFPAADVRQVIGGSNRCVTLLSEACRERQKRHRLSWPNISPSAQSLVARGRRIFFSLRFPLILWSSYDIQLTGDCCMLIPFPAKNLIQGASRGANWLAVDLTGRIALHLFQVICFFSYHGNSLYGSYFLCFVQSTETSLSQTPILGNSKSSAKSLPKCSEDCPSFGVCVCLKSSGTSSL